MFGKLGRSGGAGRGSGKRPPSMPVQLHRSGEAGGARNPIGGPAPARARPGPQVVAGAVAGREEKFCLEPGKLDFGAIIRLTPDIVEEIRRVEAQGGAAKIKFDANANNPAGNVVEVGGKEFRFTWSQELPDLCDIYEELRNGDDGDGLLVECGAAWRKLNVQRILDESAKNHVKMRSEEAERMLKSRKAIVLDPTNPSVKSQAKSMAAAAVEGNMGRKGWNHKKEMLFKKRKESNQGVAAVSHTKSVSKSATTSNGNFKGIPSPVPSSPQQPRPRILPSTSGTVNTQRGDKNPGEITPPLNIYKEEIEILDKEMPTRVARGSMQDINGYEGGHTDPSIDLRSMLITLLTQNPKGMSLKALEKAVGERIPNSVKKIEIVLKNIAMFQAPGRYLLKQGQVESSKRSSEGGSSPDCLNRQAIRAASELSEKAIDESLDQETLSSKLGEGSDLFERIDRMHDSEDPLDIDIEGKTRSSSVLRADSSSESGSGSDSESDSSSGSDSGSQSRSRSKSRSPAGSGSASSSGSESDGSSSSKEASDMDVDIMTTDDEQGVAAQRMDATVATLSKSPGVWRSGGEHDINDSFERDQKTYNASSAIDLSDFGSTYERVNSVADAKNLHIDRSAKSFEKQEAKIVESIDSYLQQSKSRSSVDGIQFSKDHKFMENQHASSFINSCNDGDKFFGRKAFNEKQTLMKDGIGEQPGNRERASKTSSKRSSNSEYLQVKPENAKRMKASSSAEASFGKEKGTLSSENVCYLSPERSRHVDQKIKMTNNQQKDEKREANLLEGSLPEHAKSAASGSIDRVQNSPNFGDAANLALEQSSRKIADSSGRKKTSDIEKPTKYAESLGRANKPLQTVCGPPDSDASALKNTPAGRISTVKGKPDENNDTSEKNRAKIAKEIFVGEKTLSAPDHRKSTDDYISHLHNPDVNGRGNVLRRELSELELGEFREPLSDAMGEDKRYFERNNSFKKMENRATVSEANAADINMDKCDGNTFSESKRQSPNSSREGMNGKVSNDGLDLSRSHSRLLQAQFRQSSRVDVAEPETMTHLDKCAEARGKNGTRIDQVVGSENEASGPKKSAASRILKDDNGHDGLFDLKNAKESKSQKSNGLKRSTERSIDVFLTYNGVDSRKSSEFSSDEENAPYMKYEKEVLGLEGPIKDFSMYKDYVREFQKRYSHYCSLNKKLEKNRNDFLKVGDDIELARGRDMGEYYSLVEKLRQMYHQRGERHKEMKRVFILLHDELKTLKQRIKDFAELHSGE